MTFNASKLPSGLNIVTFNMPYVNTVSINIIVKVGSRYESVSENGISHFLEHMAFKGTKNRSSLQIAKEFDNMGGCFNAYTSREQTVYYTKVLTEHFENALEILADILQNSLFTKEDIDKELGVILQEMAGVNDNPDDLVYEKFYALAYGDHPLGRSILGTQKNLENFDSSSFRKYMDKHYSAENIYISIAGNLDHTKTEKLTSKFFAGFSSDKREDCEKAKYLGGYEFTSKKLEQTTIAIGFESFSYYDMIEFYHAQILSVIFGGGLSSRLFQKIREELGLAYAVGSFNSAYLDSGIFSLYASADHKNIALLLDNLAIEIGEICKNITDEEIGNAQMQIKASIYMAEEKSEYKSEEIGKNFSLFGKYFSLDEVMNIVMSTTKNDLLSVAHKIFSSPPTLAIVGEEPENFNFDDWKNKVIATMS